MVLRVFRNAVSHQQAARGSLPPHVTPGVYRANVSKDGFASIVKDDIERHVQDEVSINFTLRIAEVVTVEAGAPLLDTESSAVGAVVDSQQGLTFHRGDFAL